MFTWLKGKNRDDFKTGEARLIFFRLSVNERELEALENLPMAYNPGMAPLENGIETLRKEMEMREGRGRIGNILGKVKDKETLDEIRARQKRGEAFLEQLKSPIKDPDQFREAFHQTKSFDNALSRLRSREFDEKDIQNLLDSDFSAFVDKKLTGRLLRAQIEMTTAASALGRINQSDAVELAAKKSQEEEAELEKTLGLKRTGQWSPEGEEMEIDESAREEHDEGYAELVQEQMVDKKAYDARHHRYALWAEQQVTPIVADRLSYESKLQLTNLLLEAREIRLEQMRQYLRRRYDRLKTGYEQAQSRFSAEDRKKLEDIFREGEEWFTVLTTIDKAQDLNQKLDLAESHLQGSNETFDETEKNRPAIEKEIRDNFAALKAKLKTLTPKQCDALIAEAEKDRAVQGGAIPVLQQLKDPKSELWTTLHEIETEQLPHLETMELAELLDARNKLAPIMAVMGLGNFEENVDAAIDPAKLSDARKAKKAIAGIAQAKDVNAVKETLSETFGPITHAADKKAVKEIFAKGDTRVATVTHDVFEKEYRGYTVKGGMVFYERGNDWGIILDQTILESEAHLEELQKQLTHELHHLEFEKNDELKSEQLKLYTNHEDWPQIKQAFLDAFPGKKPAQYEGPEKSAYTVVDWKDEDVVSELFAMQQELNEPRRPDDTSPFGRLRSLLVNSGIAAMAAGITDPKEAKEIVRGYDGDDPSLALAEGGEGGGGKEPSETAKGSYENYRIEIEEHEKNINEILGSEYIGYVPVIGELLRAMKDFNENSKQLNEEFKKTGSDFLSALLGDRNKKIKGDLQKIMKNLATVGGEIPNKTMNPFRRIWIRTSFLAITDIFQMVKDVVEYIKRRHERKKEDHAARLGMALFGNTNLGREFHAREQKAEHTEVEEWKGRYEHLDAWKLYHLIDGMARAPDPNKDQLKAILKILASKGRIDWRYEGLWKVFNKLQSAVHLTPGDPVLLHNPPLLRQKLHTATGEIWNDYDFYTGLEKENDDAYDSSKKKFFTSLSRIPDQLTERMEQLLRMKRENKNVEASEYEAVIEFAIENGKSYQEAALFHLMMGIAEGILTPDRGLALDDKHLNKFPATQWIYSKKPPLSRSDYKQYALTYFKKDFEKGKVGPDFKTFFWTHIQNDEMTMQRVQKSVSERGWDHDWTRGIAGNFDAHTVKRFLQGKSGQEEAKITGVQNAVTGLLQWFEENAKVANRMDFRRHFAHRMSGVAMMDGIFNDVAYQKVTGAPYTRMSGSVGNGTSREAGVGNHEDWNTFRQFEQMQHFLDLFDKPLFTMLRDKTSARTDPAAHGDKIISYLKDHYGQDTKKWNEFKKLDDVFDDMDTVIKIVTGSKYVSDAKFLNNIAWLRQGVKEGK